ncbi:MAG: tetratricopeptide repeat protein [Clostridiales bacterium]|nr:tetratricopeptide repeat protein [Clostridiales bacterium]
MAKELFANTKNKIVPFDQDGEFFYRRAKKFEEHNDYIEALNYYRKAVEKDPDNIEYMLNLAETFTEMNCFHESNRILFSMIHSEEVVPDCYFGLGCNFLGLQDFDRAKESFEKYLEVDEFGMYAHDAFDLIHILENQNIFVMPSHDLHEDDEEIYELANNGRMLIDRGEYKEGIKQLEKVLTKNPKVTFAKNNLALAYFCNGEIEKAIDTSKEILRVEPRNIHAICNLTIFLYETGEKQKAREYVKTLTNITPTDGEDIHKIASTLCELKKHSDAYRYLKMLLQYKPYEIKVLHYTAVAAFNLQKFNEALIYWDKIEKIAPNNTISSFYRRYVIDIIKGAVEWREISYNYQVTYEEMINRIKKINKYMNMPKAEFKRQWEVGSTLYTLLSWGVTLNDNGIKKSILLTVGRLGDKAAEKFLKDFLLRENETEGLKRDALAILKHINASEPYIAYINDKLV